MKEHIKNQNSPIIRGFLEKLWFGRNLDKYERTALSVTFWSFIFGGVFSLPPIALYGKPFWEWLHSGNWSVESGRFFSLVMKLITRIAPESVAWYHTPKTWVGIQKTLSMSFEKFLFSDMCIAIVCGSLAIFAFKFAWSTYFDEVTPKRLEEE